MSGSVDPFTIEDREGEAGRGRLDEMGVVLARTSMSPIVYEVLDFACGITRRARRRSSPRTTGSCLFTGTFRPQVNRSWQAPGVEGMRAGDVFMTNVPYGGGTHTADVALVKPIFAEGRRASRSASP